MTPHLRSLFNSACNYSLLFVMLCLSAISACQPNSLPFMKQKPAVTANGAVPSDIPLNVFEGDGPVYAHRKPKPERTYELIMTIGDAPGPFKVIEGDVTVQAKSDACAPIQPISGAQIGPRVILPIALQKISNNEYKAIFHADPLVDEAFWENYPACEWAFTAVSVFLKATGADGETGFNHEIWAKELGDDLPIKKYFWKKRYPRSGIDNFPDGGGKTIDEFKPEVRKELFSITLTARKLEP